MDFKSDDRTLKRPSRIHPVLRIIFTYACASVSLAAQERARRRALPFRRTERRGSGSGKPFAFSANCDRYDDLPFGISV